MRPPLDLMTYECLEPRVGAIETDGFVYFPAAVGPSDVASLRQVMGELRALPDSFDRYHTAKERGFFQAHINNDRRLHAPYGNLP